MRDVDSVGVTFVNMVLGQGILNGVVNIALGVFQFSPGADDKVEPDLRTVSRLRMDLVCARQMHEALGKLLSSVDQEIATLQQQPVNGADKAVEHDNKPN